MILEKLQNEFIHYIKKLFYLSRNYEIGNIKKIKTRQSISIEFVYKKTNFRKTEKLPVIMAELSDFIQNTALKKYCGAIVNCVDTIDDKASKYSTRIEFKLFHKAYHLCDHGFLPSYLEKVVNLVLYLRRILTAPYLKLYDDVHDLVTPTFITKDFHRETSFRDTLWFFRLPESTTILKDTTYLRDYHYKTPSTRLFHLSDYSDREEKESFHFIWIPTLLQIQDLWVRMLGRYSSFKGEGLDDTVEKMQKAQRDKLFKKFHLEEKGFPASVLPSLKNDENPWLEAFAYYAFKVEWDGIKNKWKKRVYDFEINDLLSLRLKDGRTCIYVAGREFTQCKYLLFNIPTRKIEDYDEFNSIDEIKDYYSNENEGRGSSEVKITPETEFIGHCSNLQAWYENDYDTRILHSNLSFPLLKKLTEAGDPKAKRVFKDEILMRVESGYEGVIKYLLEENYFDFLDAEECQVVKNMLNGELKQAFMDRYDPLYFLTLLVQNADDESKFYKLLREEKGQWTRLSNEQVIDALNDIPTPFHKALVVKHYLSRHPDRNAFFKSLGLADLDFSEEINERFIHEIINHVPLEYVIEHLFQRPHDDFLLELKHRYFRTNPILRNLTRTFPFFDITDLSRFIENYKPLIRCGTNTRKYAIRVQKRLISNMEHLIENHVPLIRFLVKKWHVFMKSIDFKNLVLLTYPFMVRGMKGNLTIAEGSREALKRKRGYRMSFQRFKSFLIELNEKESKGILFIRENEKLFRPCLFPKKSVNLALKLLENDDSVHVHVYKDRSVCLNSWDQEISIKLENLTYIRGSNHYLHAINIREFFNLQIKTKKNQKNLKRIDAWL